MNKKVLTLVALCFAYTFAGAEQPTADSPAGEYAVGMAWNAGGVIKTETFVLNCSKSQRRALSPTEAIEFACDNKLDMVVRDYPEGSTSLMGSGGWVSANAEQLVQAEIPSLVEKVRTNMAANVTGLKPAYAFFRKS